MIYKTLKNTDLKISTISLGNWLTLGDRISESDYKPIFDLAVNKGINLIDTADSYNKGQAEISLGKLIKNYDRQKLCIATKVFFNPETEKVEGLSKSYITKAIDASLTRLATDYIDIYQCHRFDPETEILETAQAMNDLITLGKIRHWGVGRWNHSQIENCLELCEKNGFIPPVINQDVYNLFNRLPEERQDNIEFLGYSPLARGVLTNKYLNSIPKNSRGADLSLKKYIYDLSPEKLELINQLKPMADKYHCSIAQLILSFYQNRNRITSIILGIRTKQQLIENLESLELHIDQTDYEKIDLLFSKYK